MEEGEERIEGQLGCTDDEKHRRRKLSTSCRLLLVVCQGSHKTIQGLRQKASLSRYDTFLTRKLIMVTR